MYATWMDFWLQTFIILFVKMFLKIICKFHVCCPDVIVQYCVRYCIAKPHLVEVIVRWKYGKTFYLIKGIGSIKEKSTAPWHIRSWIYMSLNLSHILIYRKYLFNNSAATCRCIHVFILFRSASMASPDEKTMIMCVDLHCEGSFFCPFIKL